MKKGFYFSFSNSLTRDDFLHVLSDTTTLSLDVTWLSKTDVYIEAEVMFEEELESTLIYLNQTFNGRVSCLITHGNHALGLYASHTCQTLGFYKVIHLADLVLHRITHHDALFLKEVRKEFERIPWDLRTTARAFLRYNLNMSRAAKALFLHRNTFQYRMRKFYNFTQMDLRDVATAFYFKLADDLAS